MEDNRYLVDELKRLVSVVDQAQVVETADTADSAIDWLSENPDGWDLALVDIFLRRGNGFSVVKHCRRVSTKGRIALMSNYSREEIKDYVLQSGVDAFFDKSFELDRLALYCKEVSLAVAE